MADQIHMKKIDETKESAELLARSVIQVSDGFQKLLASGLSERALIVLLKDIIGPSKISNEQIKLVLNSLPQLKRWYIKS